jgi:hypothetical protein
MVKKLFALASVTALTGLIAAVAASGCSSTENIVTDPGEGGTDAKGVDAKPKDTGPDPDVVEPAGTCPSTDPITAADIEKQIQWLPPKPFQSVCTQANIDDLKALFKAAPPAGVAFTDINAKLGPACAACAFSSDKDTTNWQVFAKYDGKAAVQNESGSCFAQVKDAACGKARFEWEECLDIACSEADCGADKRTACFPKSYKVGGACKAITDAYVAACPDEQAYIDACGTTFKSLAVSCAGGPSAIGDGGTIDASNP